MKKFVLFFANFCLLTLITCAQKKDVTYPEIGKISPKFFLSGIKYYPEKNVSSEDFKGRWVILDFWSSSCVSCIQNFPKINLLRKQFNNKIEFILIGYKDDHIESLFEKFKNKFELQLPIVYDTNLFKIFEIPSVPHVIWIDDKGIIKAITTSRELTTDNLQSFLTGDQLNLAVKGNKISIDEKRSAFHYDKPLLINNNGGNDTEFLFRSLLTPMNIKEMPFMPAENIEAARMKNILQVTGMPLSWLYKMAYGDTLSPYPDLNNKSSYGNWCIQQGLFFETTDTSNFVHDNQSGKNLYCYSLIVPKEKGSSKYMQEVMQRDLQNYFGYDVTVELRIMPYWELVANSGAKEKLKTRGDKPKFEGDYLRGFRLTNQPIFHIIRSLWAMHQLGPPFIDRTGISSNIDFVMESGTFDLNDALKCLRKNGLDLVKNEKEMKVIVIRNRME